MLARNNFDTFCLVFEISNWEKKILIMFEKNLISPFLVEVKSQKKANAVEILA